MKYKIYVGLMLLVPILAVAGFTGGKPMTLEKYYKELAVTGPSMTSLLKPGSAEEKTGIETFKEYYKIFAENVIRRDTKKLYAKEVFFKDGY